MPARTRPARRATAAWSAAACRAWFPSPAAACARTSWSRTGASSTRATRSARWRWTARGALYATGGDGASFNFADWGQDGNPVNPCNDPHTGSSPTPPNAEGGALRSQDLRTSGDPVSLDGSLIRVDANTGQGVSGNPMFASSDPNARRIVAEGLRNPFRFDLAESGNVWIGDVGWNTSEEIDRRPQHAASTTSAGPATRAATWSRQPGYDAANLGICETLYGQANRSEPLLRLQPLGQGGAGRHAARPAPRRSPACGPTTGRMRRPSRASGRTRSSSPTTAATASGRCAPAPTASRIPSTVQTFDAGASNPVWLEVGPDGALYYADFDGGRIMRIQSTAANQSPTAAISADPTSGHAPLEVDFDGTASSDPDHDSLAYAWDLDGDGELDDSTSATPTYTYTAGGSYDVKLRVSDGRGGSDTATTTIDVDNSPPVPTITSPLPTSAVGGGRPHRLQRLGPGRRGRHAAGLGAALEAADPPLPVELPHAPHSGLDRHRRRDAGRTRPRMALLPAAAADRHRLRWR